MYQSLDLKDGELITSGPGAGGKYDERYAPGKGGKYDER